MRYFIELSYRGTAYHGWQRQGNALSIQEIVEKALSVLLKQPIGIIGSGRTDTGVHAEQQFAHFDCEEIADLQALTYKLNKFLPPDVSIKRLFVVESNVHARFTATARKYEYRICYRKNPFLQNLIYEYQIPLDIALMNQAAQLLLRYDNFQSFSLVNTQVKTFRCKITEAVWIEESDLLIFHIRADRFLRGMVRAIVGTLLEIGRGRTKVGDFEQIILSKDRRMAGRAAPPQGLFLMEVSYPPEVFEYTTLPKISIESI